MSTCKKHDWHEFEFTHNRDLAIAEKYHKCSKCGLILKETFNVMTMELAQKTITELQYKEDIR